LDSFKGFNAMSILSAPHFHDEAAAFARVEKVIWPQGPVCHHCGAMDRITSIKPNVAKRVRMGLKKCGHCKGQFTVRMGTIFEESKLPLHIWLQAMHLMASSKKGISAHQLHRTLEITYKSAWFLAHRIREAMASGDVTPFGEHGGGVEADETYIGRVPGVEISSGHGHKHAVLSLIDRDTGRARSQVITDFRAVTIGPILQANVSRKARFITDEASTYKYLGWNFADHVSVNHSRGEYVSRQDKTITTNTVEGFFSIFKKGMTGIYQHCSGKHLHRYLAEFDFRYTNRVATGVDDQDRAERTLLGVKGKRLTYRSTGVRPQAA
jgi:transposase-like protein